MSSHPGPSTIDTRALRRVLNAVIDHIETTEGQFIEVDRDHYWQLRLEVSLAEDLRVPGTGVDDFEVGQISDDVRSVSDLAVKLDQGDALMTPWHDLEHAVGLLRALAWMDLPS